MEDKKVATVGMMMIILKNLSLAPISQMDKHVRDEILEFNENDHTPTEMFDFLQSISEKPMIKLNEKVCVGEISSFVQSLCDLNKFYLRP